MSVTSEEQAKTKARIRARAKRLYTRESFSVTADARRESYFTGYTACVKDVRKIFNKASDAEEVLASIRDWLEKQP